MKLYYNLLSQPSRAVYIFLKTNDIQFESCHLNLLEGEHRTEEFAAINPFQLVPVIDDNGFKLTESIAILRYLHRQFNVADHWYPKDSRIQARVDEYLEWQHINTRVNGSMFFQHKFLLPKMFGREVNTRKVEEYQNKLETTLHQFETVWLKDRPFIAGDQLTIADLLAACELEQPSMADYDVREGRPLLTAWFNRVKEALQPEYDEAHNVVYIIRNKSGGKVSGAKL
ncbi:glutathione S-transferase theta-1 isoform X2 [Cherax quadricarinatus]|uniref:glutathione S-transferase theta-1 isoform X2 n=1 Tax=Cherax quadricarinatus TaxID=27406 RepID=UPI0023790112|nr:glutathione S-transferase theta-1-like isoform X2 [Cherax quadricarinatus]